MDVVDDSLYPVYSDGSHSSGIDVDASIDDFSGEVICHDFDLSISDGDFLETSRVSVGPSGAIHCFESYRSTPGLGVDETILSSPRGDQDEGYGYEMDILPPLPPNAVIHARVAQPEVLGFEPSYFSDARDETISEMHDL